MMKQFAIFFVLLLFSGIGISHANPDFTLGEVEWSEFNYPSTKGTKASVIVIDPDMNKSPKTIDYLWVSIHSDTDPEGFKMTLFESDFDSGEFLGNITFVDYGESDGGFLRVRDGDTITVRYIDTTIPKTTQSLKSNEIQMEVTATSLAGLLGVPLERVPASNFRISDLNEKPLVNNLVPKDQQVIFVSDLVNQQNYSQPFTYIVQIRNEQNQVESLSWLTGNLTAYQEISSEVSWIPFFEGTYTATVFVWESLGNPTALSPPLELELKVK